MRDIVIDGREIEFSVYTTHPTDSSPGLEPHATGLSMRNLPSLIILDEANRIVMYNDPGLDVLRRLANAQQASEHDLPLPELLGKTVDALRRSHVGGDARPVSVPLAFDTFARVSTLRGSNSVYMVVTFERLRSRDSAAANFRRFGLTARERDVAMLLLRGISNRTIAHRLHLAENTVQCHLKTIFNKCGVHTRLQFAAKMHGLADGSE